MAAAPVPEGWSSLKGKPMAKGKGKGMPFPMKGTKKGKGC